MHSNNNKIHEFEADLKVLEERVKKNEEILNIWLKTYRNYGLIIVAILTLLGIGSVWFAVRQIVRATTEAKLDQILSDKYIEEQIGKRSEPAIDKLIAEFDTRARKLLEETLTYEVLKDKAIEALLKRDYENCVRYLKRAKEKVNLLYNSFDPGTYRPILCDLSLNIAETQIFKGDYGEALAGLEDSFSAMVKIQEKAGWHFLDCIARKLLGYDTSETEKKFNEIIVKKFNLMWSVEPMEDWLNDADISEDSESYIRDKIEALKEHLR